MTRDSVTSTARTKEHPVRFHLLGSMTVDADGRVVDLGPPKQRSVLAVLLLHANEIVPTDRIIDLVWGDEPPRTAEHSVQIYVSELRKALSNGSNGDLIETRPPGYVLNLPPEMIDTHRFERLVREGLAAVRTGDAASGRPKLERALDSWTGSPLADFAYEDFAQGHIRSLQELHSDAIETLCSLHLDLGDLDTARDLARQAIETDPLREEPRRLMMMALYRTGRQADALRLFGEYRGLLAEELGIEPSASLRDLEERILLQDSALDLRPKKVSDGNPYRGLRAFSEEDTAIYFGREDLVKEVLERLRNGPGFVSIVGPSGSGKSSVARAGVLPVLREQGETVVVFQPGTRPLWELAGALDRAGFGTRASLSRRFETDPRTLVTVVDRSVVLIVDQFEELFTLAETDAVVRFSELIGDAIRDHRTPLRVIATLRADYYDRPLSVPALAGVFSDSVVSVKPMTPAEIERAVVEPAHLAGVSVEPGLLAQLVADMGDEPGALPLLQFTLFELFERSNGAMRLDTYRDLGGIHGALTGGADQVLGELDTEGRGLVEQVMIRMVRKGKALATSRPVLLRELMDLGVDTVALQGVLEAFGSRRLLTFDRDASGAAVVAMAHEYLITEWPRLVTWITEHSTDLDRLYALDTATSEWETSERSEDYLLRGERLDRFSEWRAETTLKLTRPESEFIDASAALRDRERAVRQEQEAKETQLTRKARRRLWAFGMAVAALAAAITVLVLTLVPDPPPDVVFWAPLGGDGGFGDQIQSGVARAAEEHGLTAVFFPDGDLTLLPGIEELVEAGAPLVIATQTLGQTPGFHEMIDEHPKTWFVWIDCDEGTLASLRPNESCIVADHRQMGYLAGAVAGMMTRTERVGVVVGMDFPWMSLFEEGFRAGVSRVDSVAEVGSIYLSWDGYEAFGSPTMGYIAASTLIGEGADVIFHAAGRSGEGVIAAAYDHGLVSEHPLWGIGVDVDQHVALEAMYSLPWADQIPIAGWQSVLLTSIVKRLDTAVYTVLDTFARTGEVELVTVTIENGGIDFVTTGGKIDSIAGELTEIRDAVSDGSEEIPLVDIGPIRFVVDAFAP